MDKEFHVIDHMNGVKTNTPLMEMMLGVLYQCSAWFPNYWLTAIAAWNNDMVH